MMGWVAAYITVGLLSVGFAAFNVKLDGGEMDPERAVFGCLAWPVFFVIVIAEMIASRTHPQDKEESR